MSQLARGILGSRPYESKTDDALMRKLSGVKDEQKRSKDRALWNFDSEKA